MNYSLFTEDEKKKINDQLGIFGFPTQSNNVGNSYSEDKQKLLDDYELKKEALETINQAGDEELNNYADNYNSLGSRAARALQSLGASFQGKDPTAVFNAQQQMKQNDIKNILDRNKNKRDLAYTEAKDVLSRIDNLDKLETDRKKNELEQQRWEKAFERQQNLDQINQSNADRNYNLELQKLNLTKDAQKQKDLQDKQNLEDQIKKEDDQLANLKYLGKFGTDKNYYKTLKNDLTREGEIYTFNSAVADSLGIPKEKQADWIKNNPALPKRDEGFNVSSLKVKSILQQQPGYQRAYVKEVNEETQQKIDEAKPGSRITLRQFPDIEFIVDADKNLYDTVNQRLVKFDNGTFKAVSTPSFK